MKKLPGLVCVVLILFLATRTGAAVGEPAPPVKLFDEVTIDADDGWNRLQWFNDALPGPYSVATLNGYAVDAGGLRYGRLELAVQDDLGGGTLLRLSSDARELFVKDDLRVGGRLVVNRGGENVAVHGYVPLETAVTVQDGRLATEAGSETVDLSAFGIPAAATAVHVRLTLRAPAAGTAAWAAGGADPAGAGPLARVAVAGGYGDDTGPTTKLPAGPRLTVGWNGRCTLWLYILGYYL